MYLLFLYRYPNLKRPVDFLAYQDYFALIVDSEKSNIIDLRWVNIVILKMLRLLSYCWILINMRQLQEQMFHPIYTPVDRSIYSRRKFWIRCSQRVSTSTNNTKFAAIDVFPYIILYSFLEFTHFILNFIKVVGFCTWI